jgi:hypothetical protein
MFNWFRRSPQDHLHGHEIKEPTHEMAAELARIAQEENNGRRPEDFRVDGVLEGHRRNEELIRDLRSF